MKIYIKGSTDLKFKHLDYLKKSTEGVIKRAKALAQDLIDSGTAAVCYAVVIPSTHSARQLRCNFEVVVGDRTPIFVAKSLDEYNQKVDKFCEGIPQRYFLFLTIFNTADTDDVMFDIYNTLVRYPSLQVAIAKSNLDSISVSLNDSNHECTMYIRRTDDGIQLEAYDTDQIYTVSDLDGAITVVDNWIHDQVDTASNSALLDVRNTMYEILVDKLNWSERYADDCVSGIFEEHLTDIDTLRDYLEACLEGSADDKESAYEQADAIINEFRAAHII